MTAGPLIAVDGGDGPNVVAAAKSLARALRAAGEGGISLWDSSGIFTELAAAEPGVPAPSARTLTLLYAADLAFRLHWQIGPLLESGYTVVAAPYVDSAKALGLAAGLPRRWLDELFRFAPRPDIAYVVHERAARLNRGQRGSYAGWLLNVLRARGDLGAAETLRKRTVGYFRSLEHRGRSIRLNLEAPNLAVVRRRARRR